MNTVALIAMVGVVISAVVCGGHAHAADFSAGAETTEAAHHRYSNEDFQDWLAALRDEALAAGIADTILDAVLKDITPDVRVIDRDRRQSEFIQTFWTYLGHCATEQRIMRGRKLLARHRALLDQIYAQFHVPPRYLIALWGVETNFGDHMGRFPIIEALATLAYDQRRARFFRAQLLDALHILNDGHIVPEAMKGSWAGAMGQMQFMPSTFAQYAVDFTGDGRKDIWHSLPDAFSSAANYLAAIGWRPGQRWGREVLLPDGFDLMLAAIGTKKTVAAWSVLGVRRANGSALPPMSMEGSIILPQGRNGPAFLVYDNFRMILKWNRSINYALCVGHLADRLIGLPEIAHGQDADNEALSRFEIKEIQRHLNFLGYDAGSVDGLLGPGTESAIRSFQAAHSLPADGYPTLDLLHLLQARVSAFMPAHQ